MMQAIQINGGTEYKDIKSMDELIKTIDNMEIQMDDKNEIIKRLDEMKFGKLMLIRKTKINDEVVYLSIIPQGY